MLHVGLFSFFTITTTIPFLGSGGSASADPKLQTYSLRLTTYNLAPGSLSTSTLTLGPSDLSSFASYTLEADQRIPDARAPRSMGDLESGIWNLESYPESWLHSP